MEQRLASAGNCGVPWVSTSEKDPHGASCVAEQEGGLSDSSGGIKDVSALDAGAGADQAGSSAAPEPGHHGSKYRDLRLNRSKRLRNRALVEWLERLIQNDPHGFDPDAYQWPPSVMGKERLKYLLTERLLRHKEAVLRQRQVLQGHNAGFGASSAAATGVSPSGAAAAPAPAMPGHTRPRRRIPTPKEAPL